jgi:hypothetical protein
LLRVSLQKLKTTKNQIEDTEIQQKQHEREREREREREKERVGEKRKKENT